MSGRPASDAIIPGRAAISVGDPKIPLPPGWAWTPLTSIADLGTGHTPSRKHPEYWGGDVPWIGIRDAGAHHGGVIHHTLQQITQLGLENSSARLLPKDTICLSRTASVGYVVKMGRDMATSQDFVTWTSTEALDPDYLLKALLAEGADIRRFGEGSTHTTIYFPEVKAFHVALPPVAEQRRIVTKIDSLTGKSRRARDHLDHIPRLVEKYKQAVLAAAFRGDLTREWRSKMNLPTNSWEAVELQHIADIGTGSTPKRGTPRYYEGGSVPWVTSGSVNDEVVNGSAECITAAALRETSCRLYPVGTLLMALYGEGKTRGKVAILGIQAATNQALAAIVINPNGPAERDFVLWYLRSQYLQLREQAAGGVQPNLNLGIVKRIRLLLPSRQEQRVIILSLERAFKWIDRLASEATSARKLIDRLDLAVLAKAFRGDLVPQDPADEPASVLLERIRAEREASPRARRGRKAKAA